MFFWMLATPDGCFGVVDNEFRDNCIIVCCYRLVYNKFAVHWNRDLVSAYLCVHFSTVGGSIQFVVDEPTAKSFDEEEGPPWAAHVNCP